MSTPVSLYKRMLLHSQTGSPGGMPGVPDAGLELQIYLWRSKAWSSRSRTWSSGSGPGAPDPGLQLQIHSCRSTANLRLDSPVRSDPV